MAGTEFHIHYSIPLTGRPLTLIYHHPPFQANHLGRMEACCLTLKKPACFYAAGRQDSHSCQVWIDGWAGTIFPNIPQPGGQ